SASSDRPLAASSILGRREIGGMVRPQGEWSIGAGTVRAYRTREPPITRPLTASKLNRNGPGPAVAKGTSGHAAGGPPAPSTGVYRSARTGSDRPFIFSAGA